MTCTYIVFSLTPQLAIPHIDVEDLPTEDPSKPIIATAYSIPQVGPYTVKHNFNSVRFTPSQSTLEFYLFIILLDPFHHTLPRTNVYDFSQGYPRSHVPWPHHGCGTPRYR